MRIIHYDMILSKPYHVGCNPNIYNFSNIQDVEAIKWPGMRMVVESCEDIEKFFASFRRDCVDNMHSKFERQIIEALRGELPEWKLATVDIDDCGLRLGYRSENLFKKYVSRHEAVKAWDSTHPGCHRSSPPLFYAESVFSYKPDVGARLRFELDDPVSGNTEITIVSFCQERENSVIECDGNKGRAFTFRRKDFPDQYPVKVEEWMI